MPERWVSFVVRALVLMAFWLLLAGAAAGSLPVGALVVAAATTVSLRLAPPGAWRLRASGTLRFVPYFLWRSLEGGTDVALRAFHPRLPLDPRFERYPLRLGPGTARVFFVNVVSLLPGTLSAQLEEDTLRVHVIGAAGAAAPRLGVLEERVAALFGVPLTDTSPDGDG